LKVKSNHDRGEFIVTERRIPRLGCLSFIAGALLAIFIPVFLVGIGLPLDSGLFWLAPGWAIFHPGRDDGAQILLATIVTAIIYSPIFYGVVHLILRYLAQRKYH
jgi:hypothetical protein